MTDVGTYSCRLSLLSHHRNALDYGGAGIVDAIKHRLEAIGQGMHSCRLLKQNNYLELYHRGSIVWPCVVLEFNGVRGMQRNVAKF